MRTVININEDWKFCHTSEIPSSLPAEWATTDLPHTWNAEDGQDGGNDYRRGTAVYVKTLPHPITRSGERVFIEIPAAAMSADVYINGTLAVHHDGGYSTFRADITDLLKEENMLCIAVDNSPNDRIYPQKADFTFYGGLYRGVNLIIVPEKHFELEKDGTPGMSVTSIIVGNDARVTIETWQTGSGDVTVTVAGETKCAPSINNHCSMVFEIKNVRLWDGVHDPFLYTAAARFGGDEITARFGVRSIEFDPQKGFLLNGRSYPLRGVCRHQDRKGLGNAISINEHLEDMEFIREIGANTVRLAHYQHAQEFYDLCDEYGIIVWAEIPYITHHMPSGQENAVSQMRELITQCHNHPSIVCWGLSNEITASGEVSEDLMENHRILNDLCHSMDSTRPTVMAHVFMLETDSPLIEIADIGSYNLYFGWYLGELEQNDRFFDDYHAKYPNRVIGLSEYGADANPAYQSLIPERGDYSETYQCLYHEHMLKCIEERPYLWATHLWNLFDFAADGRDEGGKHGENQKGLVTFDRRLRKDAFYLYKAYWSDEPFVHICGRRYVDRTEALTEIKIYSNCDNIALMVDGEKFAEQTGSRMFTFSVPICGVHTITAVSGELSDSITIRKADKVNPDYRMLSGEVVNWFDRDTYDPNCYSIKDTLGVLKKDPKAGAIVGRMMESARASRGDVAKAASSNMNLEKLMAQMTLESILKQAGPAIKPEQVIALNEALQKIKKA